MPDDGPAAHDFLSYSGGILSWSANTTGKPRSAAITLPDGSVFSITQIGPDDFKGNWTFTAKVFAGAGAYKPKDAAPWTVSIGKPLKGESLKYANDSKTYANNIGIAGLYGNAVLDGCVDIDYDAQTVRVGLFLDCRDDSGQLISSGASDSNGKYAVFSPELVSQTATTWSSPWFFNETDLGTPDYTWMWLTVSSDFSKLSYANRTSASRVLPLRHELIQPCVCGCRAGWRLCECLPDEQFHGGVATCKAIIYHILIHYIQVI